LAGEIDTAFAKLVEQRAGALHLAADAFFNTRNEQFVVPTARRALPAIFHFREYVVAGGLMSYGPSLSDASFFLTFVVFCGDRAR
jgi:putative ABC transport system substrate-binding protein